jgi:cytochrome oxidase Cu insertion factor (SCO1/SenC/PrrC family)
MPQLSPARRRVMTLLVAAPFVVAACGGAASDYAAETTGGPTADTAAAAVTTDAAGATEVTSASDASSGGDTTAAAGPAWLDIELTDAATGETFTVASLKGEPVALEPMAIWCTNCKAQQDNVRQVYADVQAAGIRYISLGIDPNEAPAALARYAERREYPWTFAQSSNQFSRALSDDFGPQILSPPSTPLILINADGEVVRQEFGFHGPDQLLALLDEVAA